MRPPIEVGPGADDAKANQANTHQGIRTNNPKGFDDLAARRRRRGAAIRSTVISTCGCVRDPEVDRHRCSDGITDVMAEAAISAAEHLEMLGTPGIFDTDACKSMWRLGRRQLGVRSYHYAQGAA